MERITDILTDYSEEKFVKNKYLGKFHKLIIWCLGSTKCLDSEYRQRSSDVKTDETDEDEYDQPSLETAKWSVYWDPDQADWYFFNKISGKL